MKALNVYLLIRKLIPMGRFSCCKADMWIKVVHQPLALVLPGVPEVLHSCFCLACSGCIGRLQIWPATTIEKLMLVANDLALHLMEITNCMLFVAVSLGMLLQGCDMDIPRHSVGNWRKNVNYLQAYSYLPPGQRSTGAVLNSCSLQNVPATEQCNGRGYCRAFSQNSFAAQQATPLSFCQCERDWADPECSTKRKSQLKAFFFSLFLGPFGGDYFYLGFPLWGISKLLTLGGLGFWWLVDIVRIGSGPVYAYDFRTAADLPHWVALLVMIFVCMMLGFAVAVLSYLFYRKEKRKDVMNLQTQEESRFWKRTQEDMQQFDGPRFRPKQMPPGSQVIQGPVGFSGYGATLPLPVPNAQVPFAQYNPQSDRPPYSGPFGPSGLPGQGSPTPASIGIAPTQMPILRNGEIPRVDNELDISIPRVQ